MVVFNYSYLDSWRSQGYKYILVLPLEKFGVLRPLANDRNLKKGYTLEMSEVNLLQIAEDYNITLGFNGVKNAICP